MLISPVPGPIDAAVAGTVAPGINGKAQVIVTFTDTLAHLTHKATSATPVPEVMEAGAVTRGAEGEVKAANAELSPNEDESPQFDDETDLDLDRLDASFAQQGQTPPQLAFCPWVEVGSSLAFLQPTSFAAKDAEAQILAEFSASQSQPQSFEGRDQSMALQSAINTSKFDKLSGPDMPQIARFTVPVSALNSTSSVEDIMSAAQSVPTTNKTLDQLQISSLNSLNTAPVGRIAFPLPSGIRDN